MNDQIVTQIRDALAESTCKDIANLVECYFGGFEKIRIQQIQESEICFCKHSYHEEINDEMKKILRNGSIPIEKITKSEIQVYFKGDLGSSVLNMNNLGATHKYFLKFLGLNQFISNNIFVGESRYYFTGKYNQFVPKENESIYRLSFKCYVSDSDSENIGNLPTMFFSYRTDISEYSYMGDIYDYGDPWKCHFSLNVCFVASKYLSNVINGMRDIWNYQTPPSWKFPNKTNCLRYNNYFSMLEEHFDIYHCPAYRTPSMHVDLS